MFFKLLMTIFVFVFAICLSHKTMAFPSAPHHAFEPIQTTTKDGVVLKGLRLAQPGGEKIVLAHGFAENTRIFRELAYLLHEAGWDVYMFNFRGHGNGSQKSLHPDFPVSSQEGVYSFDNWIAQDVPAILDFVGSDQKITVLGHSLGGDALRLFLSGIRAQIFENGKFRIIRTSDIRKIKKYSDRIKTLHAVGSPTSFDKKADLKFVFWSMLPEFLQRVGLSIFSMKQETHSESHGIKTKEILQEALHRSIHTAGGYQGLVGKGFEVTSAEMARTFRKAITYDIPLDLVKQVNYWIPNGFQSWSGVSFQKLLVPSSIRFIQTVAIEDGLAPADQVLEDTRQFRFHHTPEFVIMQDHQHLDMVSGKSGASRVFSIIQEKNGGAKYQFTDMIRKTLVLPQRCVLYFNGF